MTKLGVNIDHIATVRQARRAVEPDPVAAAGRRSTMLNLPVHHQVASTGVAGNRERCR